MLSPLGGGGSYAGVACTAAVATAPVRVMRCEALSGGETRRGLQPDGGRLAGVGGPSQRDQHQGRFDLRRRCRLSSRLGRREPGDRAPDPHRRGWGQRGVHRGAAQRRRPRDPDPLSADGLSLRRGPDPRVQSRSLLLPPRALLRRPVGTSPGGARRGGSARRGRAHRHELPAPACAPTRWGGVSRLVGGAPADRNGCRRHPPPARCAAADRLWHRHRAAALRRGRGLRRRDRRGRGASAGGHLVAGRHRPRQQRRGAPARRHPGAGRHPLWRRERVERFADYGRFDLADWQRLHRWLGPAPGPRGQGPL